MSDKPPAMEQSEPETAVGSKRTRQGSRKPPHKKSDGKPSRPLSAYNAFFREERVRWHAEQKVLKLAATPGGKKANAFLAMTKAIGERWKALPLDKRKRYIKIAEEDLKRYRNELQEYKTKMMMDTKIGRAYLEGRTIGGTSSAAVAAMCLENPNQAGGDTQPPTMASGSPADQLAGNLDSNLTHNVRDSSRNVSDSAPSSRSTNDGNAEPPSVQHVQHALLEQLLGASRQQQQQRENSFNVDRGTEANSSMSSPGGHLAVSLEGANRPNGDSTTQNQSLQPTQQAIVMQLLRQGGGGGGGSSSQDQSQQILPLLSDVPLAQQQQITQNFLAQILHAVTSQQQLDVTRRNSNTELAAARAPENPFEEDSPRHEQHQHPAKRPRQASSQLDQFLRRQQHQQEPRNLEAPPPMRPQQELFSQLQIILQALGQQQTQQNRQVSGSNLDIEQLQRQRFRESSQNTLGASSRHTPTVPLGMRSVTPQQHNHNGNVFSMLTSLQGQDFSTVAHVVQQLMQNQQNMETSNMMPEAREQQLDALNQVENVLLSLIRAALVEVFGSVTNNQR